MTREEAKAILKTIVNPEVKEAIETLIPELSENEDEKIRMALVEYFAAPVPFTEVRGIPVQKVRNWLEKREESKRELPLPVRRGDTDAYFHDLRMTTKPLNSRGWFNEGMKYAQRLQKEQKSKDVEEKYLDGIKRDWFERGKKEVLTVPELYGLEKQKEHKEIPLMNGDADLYFDEWNQQHSNSTKRECFEAGMSYAVRLLTEDSPMLEEFKKGFEQAILWGREGYKVSPDRTIKSLTQDEIDEVLDEQKEQKPAWSDEDEDFINMLILHFNYLIDKGGDSVETYKSYIEKLKSLRPQPKQEWSEEDVKTFWGLTAYIPDEELKRLGVTRLDILKKFKSLRPVKQEWSEENEEIIANAIKQLYSYADSYHTASNYTREKEIRKVAYELKSLCPQPKQEWSKEDRRHLDRIRMVLESWDRSHISLAGLPSLIPDDIDWLEKKLKCFYSL